MCIRDRLNTEGYGGMLCATWFDRPLSIAGRVLVQEGDNYVTKLVNICLLYTSRKSVRVRYFTN